MINTARTASSAASPEITSSSSWPNWVVHAFSDSGRLSVSRPTGPRRSQISVSRAVGATTSYVVEPISGVGGGCLRGGGSSRTRCGTVTIE